VVKHWRLLEERDALDLRIQELPGFEGFLKIPSFNNFRAPVSRGTVIMIKYISQARNKTYR